MRIMSLAFILAIIPCASGETPTGVNMRVLNKDSLSNPDLRSRSVADLAEQSRAAKAIAQQKAQKFGWHIKGEADGIHFELMSLRDGRPIYYITQNVNAAISTAASFIRGTPPYNLDGSGLTVGIWDAGAVLPTHQEFGARVSVMDGAGSHWHSTHVGGTIGASGVDPAAMGMAPNVALDSYNWDYDDSEMASRSASYPAEPGKIYLSNHSYGIATGWVVGSYSGNYGYHWFGVWPDREADGFGQYCSETAAWDSICYSAPYFLPFISVGNDRGDYAPSNGTTFYYFDANTWQSKSYNSSTDPYDDGWDNGGFDTIPHQGNAKNVMTIGAVSDAVQNGLRYLPFATMTSFSSWGPTDDGRIKPDIVANGTELFSTTDSSTASYDSLSGTSMSAPNASGSVVLLIQLYDRLFPGQAMRASTLKALIIHTADDLGNPGPDYSFGWGLMNTKAAADLIIDNDEYPTTNKIVEGLLDAENPNDSFSFIWNGEDSIRATLCWTDPPATALEELDNPSPRLINDLDLRIIDPNGSIYYPYILNPAMPAYPATTGDNARDNVEQVYIPSPNSPGIYSVKITHKGALTDGAQNYSLIVTGQTYLLLCRLGQSRAARWRPSR
jgi:subtilisin family serine protease